MNKSDGTKVMKFGTGIHVLMFKIMNTNTQNNERKHYCPQMLANVVNTQ